MQTVCSATWSEVYAESLHRYALRSRIVSYAPRWVNPKRRHTNGEAAQEAFGSGFDLRLAEAVGVGWETLAQPEDARSADVFVRRDLLTFVRRGLLTVASDGRPRLSWNS